MFRVWYGMEMEEEDEKLVKTYVVVDMGMVTPLGRWLALRWVKNAATWELPKTHKIRLGEGEQVSQNLSQFEKSNFTSISI